MLFLLEKWSDVFSLVWVSVLIMIKYLQISHRLWQEDCSQCGDSVATVFSCDWREWRYQPRTELYSHLTSVQSAGPGTHYTQYRGTQYAPGPENNIGRLGWWDVMCTNLHPPVGKTFFTGSGSILFFSPLIKKIPCSPVASSPNHTSVIRKSWAKINILCPWSLLSIIFISKIPVYKR